MLLPAPHWLRLMMLGGCPGPSAAVGGVHWVSTGDSGGVISTADMFCAIDCSAFAGMYPSSRPASRAVSGGVTVTSASGGLVMAICTVVVLPTKTGSVPRGPPSTVSSELDSRFSVSYQGPHEPSVCLARTRAEVPVRSFPVSATIENGADWLISRMVSPPPTPAKGWCTRIVSSALGTSCPLVPETPVNVNGTATTVAAMAVNKIVGTGRRDDTP